MDRPTVYFGQVPRSLDNLNLGQFAMVGLAKLAEAMLGTATAVTGFSVTPTSPASLTVNVGPGQIYETENLEASVLSMLAVDTHSILKQGINLDPQTLTFTPPATVGFAQSFLIEVQYQDSDTGQILLTYQNIAGGTYQGPGGNGQQQNTIRKGVAALAIKAGVAATSGTQTTPPPDAGYVGVAVITVAYGQTTITSGNIVPYAAAPTIPVTLPGVPAGVQANQWTYAVDQSGAAGTIVANLAPIPLAFPDGLEVVIKTANAAAGADVANINSLGNLPIKRRGGSATAANDWPAGAIITLRKLGSAWQFSGITPSDVSGLIPAIPAAPGATQNGFLAKDSNNNFTLWFANGVADNRPMPVDGDETIVRRASDGAAVTVLNSALASYVLAKQSTGNTSVTILGDGTIIQRFIYAGTGGTHNASGGPTQAFPVTFPVAFPNEVDIVLAMDTALGSSSACYSYGVDSAAATKSTCSLYCTAPQGSAFRANMIAIGR